MAQKKVLTETGLSRLVTLINNKYAPSVSPALTGSPTAPTQTASDDSTKIATTAFVHDNTDDKAPLDSPALTGTPTAPTPTTNDDSTKIATTAFVQDAIDGMEPVNGITDSDIATAWGDVTPAENVPSFNGTINWNNVSNKPTFATVATSGNYDDLSNKPTIPTVPTNISAFTNDSNYATLASPAFTGTPTAPTPVANDNSTKIATTEYVQEEIRTHANLPIGFEYFQTNPNVPAGSLPMLGGVYSRETYADLWDWVQTQTGYLITDSAWVTLSNTQNGNVPFYSSGDGSTTFRVPSLKCWIKGTDGTETVGTYLDAGLPNITGSHTYDMNNSEQAGMSVSGCYTKTDTSNIGRFDSMIGSEHGTVNFNASLSNSIYGNANTVVPESIVGMWLVKAYGTVVDTGTIDEQAYIDEQLAINVPTGCVQAFAGNTTPSGWLLCDGSAVSRTQYSRLFGVIGTTYGSGDGTDTFNLPDLVDKFIQGNSVAGTEHSAGLPNITGKLQVKTNSGGYYAGFYSFDAFYGTGGVGNNMATAGGEMSGTNVTTNFDASRSSSIYGNSSTVQPPSVTMRYIIKY